LKHRVINTSKKLAHGGSPRLSTAAAAARSRCCSLLVWARNVGVARGPRAGDPRHAQGSLPYKPPKIMIGWAEVNISAVRRGYLLGPVTWRRHKTRLQHAAAAAARESWGCHKIHPPPPPHHMRVLQAELPFQLVAAACTLDRKLHNVLENRDVYFKISKDWLPRPPASFSCDIITKAASGRVARN